RRAHIGHAELDVQREVAVKAPMSVDVASLSFHDAAFEQFPGPFLAVAPDPAVETLAIEEHDGPLRRRHAFHVNFVLGFRQFQIADVAVLSYSQTGTNEDHERS